MFCSCCASLAAFGCTACDLSLSLQYTGAVGPPALTLFRCLQFSVFLFVIVYGNTAYAAPGGTFFIFFTNWTFVLFGLTGLTGTVLTARAWRRQRRPTIPCIEASPAPSLTPGWTLANRFYHLLLETVCAASIMLTIFYWVADYVPGSAIRVDNPFKHGVSAFLLLMDLAISQTPLISYHIQAVVAYGTVYVSFLWLYFAGTGTWVYRALDWSKTMAPVYYTALPLLLMLAFLIMFMVVGLRELFSSKAFMARCCFSSCCCTNDELHVTAVEFIVAKPLSLSTQQLQEPELSAVPPVEQSTSFKGEQPSPSPSTPVLRTQTSSRSSTASVVEHSPTPKVTIVMR